MRMRLFALLALLLVFGSVTGTASLDDEEYSQRFERIMDHYMNTKDGLVHNRMDLAQAWAERLETSFSTIPNSLFEEDDVPVWLELREVLVQSAGDIVDAENLDEQREALAQLSHGLKDFIEHFGNPGETIYIFRCRYFEEEDLDAMWLNRTERVANPYHGPENIECGEIVGEL